MRVLFSPHHYGPLLTPDIAAEALAQGWREAKPNDELVVHPHSDGSTGFLNVVPGTMEIISAATPTGPVPVSIVRRTVEGNSWHTVYCLVDETADATQVSAEEVAAGSSAVVGILLAELLDRGVRRVVISAGFAPWHDGGAGLLEALAHRLDVATFTRKAEAAIDPDLAELVAPVRAALAGVEIIVASSREVPLRGLHGAGAELANSPHITPQQAQDLEARTNAFVTAIDKILPALEPAGLLGGADLLASRRSFVGAGGGAAFILLALGAKVLPGAWVTGEETELSEAMADCDLVITGSQIIAGEELGNGVIADVATRAGVGAIPVIAVGSRIDASRGQLFKAGVNTAYQVTDTPASRPQILAPPVTEEALVARGRRLARTWSR